MPMTLSSAKDKASRVRNRLASFGQTVTHSQALELVATVYGDANWAAMRSRLLKPCADATPQSTLKLFNIALGAPEFIGKQTVVCFTREQAVDHLQRYYGVPYDSELHSYGEMLKELDDSCAPAPSNMAEWLAGLMQAPFAGAPALDAFWALALAYDLEPPLDGGEADPEVLEQALLGIAPHFQNAQALFHALYAALPEDSWYSSTDETVFTGV